jgi:glyoxylase-like metal-dependent hydrolase (beta-lactamase superfamily II)
MSKLIIPNSTSTVALSVIDTETRISFINTSTFLEPADPSVSHFVIPPSPAYAFLVEHIPSAKKVLFDLGIRKDLENLAPRNQKLIKSTGWKITRSDDSAELLDVYDVLEREGKIDIDAIIWSHWHWDHAGDPTRFPKGVELIVGPGFHDKLLPGYPTNPTSGITEDAWRYEDFWLWMKVKA